MKTQYILLFAVLFSSNLSWSQDGRIISKELFVLPDSVSNRIAVRDTVLSKQLQGVDYYRIIYLSDGLKVVAYLAQPKDKGKYPCIISNRGGNRDFGQWNLFGIATHLKTTGAWRLTESQVNHADGRKSQFDPSKHTLYRIITPTRMFQIRQQWGYA
jgi:hypothetical protein